MSALRKNIAHLFVLQGANYVLPLITVPYLVRVLGPEHYGRIAFAQAFIHYFVVLTNYGFDLSATRAVALARDDPSKLSRLFSAVMLVKFLLMLLGFGIMLLCIWLSPLLVYLTVVGNALFPVWLFQGMERLHHISIFTIIARSLTVIAIFALVHEQADYRLAAALQASSMVLAGLLALSFVPCLAPVRLHWPGFAQLRQVAVDGWHVFLSTAAISLYTTSNVFFLGLLAPPTAVGYFSAAEKLVKAVQGLITPVAQAVYPHVAALSARSRDDALKFIGKLLHLQGAATLALSLLLLILAAPAVHLLLGDQFKESVRLVQLMSVLPFVVGLSNVFGVQTMLVFNMDRAVSRIVTALGIMNVFMIIGFVYAVGVVGAAISVVFVEVMVTASYAFCLHRSGILGTIVHRKIRVAHD